MSRLWTRVRRLPVALEAGTWLMAAWLTLDVLPGRLYRRLLPSARASDRWSPDGSAAALSADRRTEGLAWMVGRMGEALPFRCVCFHRGIATYQMLRRRGIPSTLHYGVARSLEGGTLRAHVWVSSGGRDIIGGDVKQEFQEIAHFPSSAARNLAPNLK